MRSIAAAFAVILGLAPCAAGKLTVTGVGGFTVQNNSGGGASGLSDLAYDPATGLYWAVSDNDNNLYPLTLDLNMTTGAIKSGSIGSPLTLVQANGDPYPGPRDQEGLTLADPGSVYVSHESSPAVSRHDLVTGWQIGGNWGLTAQYPALRSNLGLESITGKLYNFWVANEEAMTTDGPTAGNGAGTTVRIAHILGGAAPRQYLYETDGDSASFAVVRSGVSGLLALADNSLLVLERAQSDDLIPRFRSRIYLVDVIGTTNVHGTGILNGSETPVGKTLLWSQIFPGLTNFAVNNFEGITPGPQLDSGEYSLLLIADNDNSLIGTNHNLYALRLALTLPGDANNDGVVDAADFLAVEANFGITGADHGLLVGDANDDGRVDGRDLLFVERHFGAALPAAGAHPIPEPGTALLLFLSVVPRRRRRFAALLTTGKTNRNRPDRAARPDAG